MMKVLALLRARWLTAASYRMNMIYSFFGLLVGFVPLYFIAGALQPIVQESIRQEGEQYFGFLVIGIVATTFVGFAVRTLPGAISGGIASGTLEALLATPTRLPTLLAGLMAYPFAQTALRGLLLLLALWAAGGPVVWSRFPLAVGIVGMIVLSHLPVGLLAAALHLVFRSSGPLVPGALAASTLLGGVYYSTRVIPEVIQPLASVMPLTYGLRALRQALLGGEPLTSVGGDVAILAGFTVVLLAAGLVAFRLALDHARRAGTLAQY